MRLLAVTSAVALLLLMAVGAFASTHILKAANGQTITVQFSTGPCPNPANQGLTEYRYEVIQTPGITNVDLLQFTVADFAANNIFRNPVDTVHGPGDGAGQWPADNITNPNQIVWTSNFFPLKFDDPTQKVFSFCMKCSEQNLGAAIASGYIRGTETGVTFVGYVPVPICKVPAIPEPGTMMLLGMGLVPMAGVIRRRRTR